MASLQLVLGCSPRFSDFGTRHRRGVDDGGQRRGRRHRLRWRRQHSACLAAGFGGGLFCCGLLAEVFSWPVFGVPALPPPFLLRRFLCCCFGGGLFSCRFSRRASGCGFLLAAAMDGFSQFQLIDNGAHMCGELAAVMSRFSLICGASSSRISTTFRVVHSESCRVFIVQRGSVPSRNTCVARISFFRAVDRRCGLGARTAGSRLRGPSALRALCEQRALVGEFAAFRWHGSGARATGS